MEFKEMTYVTENGTVLFSPLGTDQDMGYTITGLASERKYMYLEEIAHHLANTEQRLKRYLDIKLTPEQIQEIDRLYKEKCRELKKARSFNRKYIPDLVTSIVFAIREEAIKALRENDTEALRDEIYYYIQECKEEFEE